MDYIYIYIFGKGEDYSNQQSNNTIESREQFVQFCLGNGMIIMNTQYQKEDKHYCTYTEMEAKGSAPPWTTDRFATLDYGIIQDRWRNAIVNVECKPNIAINSDHAMLVSNVKIKLKGESKKDMEKVGRYRKPTDNQIKAYSKEVEDKIDDYLKDKEILDAKDYMETFVNCILNSAKNNLDVIDPKQRNPYISKKTWDLIEERDKHRKAGRSEDEQETNKILFKHKQADEDKLCHIVNKLEQGANLKEKWQGIKDSKSKFIPTVTRHKYIRGNRVLPKKKAEAIAEYLSEIQWKNENTTEVKTNPCKIISDNLNIDEGRITTNEIEVIIKRLKTNKAPGPDKSTTELYKFLYISNYKYIEKLLNLLWDLEAVPEELTEANVASIFKKGDTQQLAIYRPISLLDTLYKIYVSIIHDRIANKLTNTLRTRNTVFVRNVAPHTLSTLRAEYKMWVNKAENT